mmetsp:Transcript_40230/g.113920  ORF Transcript_40230/g.113920 Transcript_40230/m.113920 type:complete len:338 (+) Transcript_40230:1269-2282(+)
MPLLGCRESRGSHGSPALCSSLGLARSRYLQRMVSPLNASSWTSMTLSRETPSPALRSKCWRLSTKTSWQWAGAHQMSSRSCWATFIPRVYWSRCLRKARVTAWSRRSPYAALHSPTQNCLCPAETRPTSRACWCFWSLSQCLSRSRESPLRASMAHPRSSRRASPPSSGCRSRHALRCRLAERPAAAGSPTRLARATGRPQQPSPAPWRSCSAALAYRTWPPPSAPALVPSERRTSPTSTLVCRSTTAPRTGGRPCSNGWLRKVLCSHRTKRTDYRTLWNRYHQYKRWQWSRLWRRWAWRRGAAPSHWRRWWRGAGSRRLSRLLCRSAEARSHGRT